MDMTRSYIEFNEGLSLSLYKCTAGKVSCGFGRNLTDRGVLRDEADLMLKNDMKLSENALYSIFGFKLFLDLSEKRRMALMDMMHNLGQTSFETFTNMITAVRERDHYKASFEILDSKYAKKDVPKRARANAAFMEQG